MADSLPGRGELHFVWPNSNDIGHRVLVNKLTGDNDSEELCVLMRVKVEALIRLDHVLVENE